MSQRGGRDFIMAGFGEPGRRALRAHERASHRSPGPVRCSSSSSGSMLGAATSASVTGPSSIAMTASCASLRSTRSRDRVSLLRIGAPASRHPIRHLRAVASAGSRTVVTRAGGTDGCDARRARAARRRRIATGCSSLAACNDASSSTRSRSSAGSPSSSRRTARRRARRGRRRSAHEVVSDWCSAVAGWRRWGDAARWRRNPM